MEQQAAAPDECELRTLDLEREDSGSFTEQLVAACRDPGVLRLANHGVPGELTARLFGLTRNLLELETAKRSQLPGYFWGTPALQLRVKELNWVEGLHVAPGTADATAEDGDDARDAYAAFRRVVTEEYVPHMARIARKLFDAVAGSKELGLDADQRASYLEERGGTFRAYRYPDAAAVQHVGMEPHTDSSVLSILNQDLVGGLQVLQRDGDGSPSWRGVRPVEGTLVVNLGDMMQAMSGDAYRSAEHRVVSGTTERMSLCYFAFPREDAVVVHGWGRYRGFSYREFREQVQADIKAAGAKVKEEKIYLGPHGAPPSQAKQQELNTVGGKQRFRNKLKEADRKSTGNVQENKVERLRGLMGARTGNTGVTKSSFFFRAVSGSK